MKGNNRQEFEGICIFCKKEQLYGYSCTEYTDCYVVTCDACGMTHEFATKEEAVRCFTNK